jgi:hypothetical protein
VHREGPASYGGAQRRRERRVEAGLVAASPGKRPPRIGVGAFNPDIDSANLLTDYEAKISTLERMVGRQALETECVKGALQQGRFPRSAPTSVIAGPTVSLSLKDAG